MDLKIDNTGNIGTNLFLTAAVILANLDYSGLAEYALRASIGGAIWLGFKLVGDWLSIKINNHKKPKL